MQESDESSMKSEGGFKVAPLISTHKLSELKVKIVGTLMGISLWNKDNHHSNAAEDYCQCNLINILFYVLLPCIVIIPPFVIAGSQQLYPVAVLVPAVLLPICHLIVNCLFKKTHHPLTYISLALYGYLWSSLLFVTAQQMQIATNNILIITAILAICSIIFSVSTLTTTSVQQFSGTTMHYEFFEVHSSFGMRFLIALPTLLAHAIISGIFLNRFQISIDSYYHDFILQLYNEACPYLGLASSVLGLICLIGWVSTFYNMVMFVINSVFNFMVFCDEKYDNSLVTSLFTFILNIVGVILTYVFSDFLLDFSMIVTAYFTAWGTSILAMLFVRIKSYVSGPSDKSKNSSKRLYVMLVIELITVIALFLIYFFVFEPMRDNFDQINTIAIVVLCINVALYVLFLFFNQLREVRSIFGCIGCISLSPTPRSTIDLIHRYILRTISTLSILAILTSIPLYRVKTSYISLFDIPFFPEVFYPILVYRTFKKYLSHPRDNWAQIPLIIYLIVHLASPNRFVILEMVLFFPLFPHNPLQILASPLFIPKKLRHKNQGYYKIVYYLSILISLILFVGTLGVGEFTMIFGLPLFWVVIPKAKIQSPDKQFQSNQNENAHSAQYSIYKKFISELSPSVFRGKLPGYYIIRVTKYILLVQLTNECYGFFQTVTFAGLQAQQTTTCHAKEGQTIDRIIAEVWDQNQNNRIKCKISDNLFTAIWPIQQVKKVMISGQNEIKLTGIIESEDFYKLFKVALVKSLVYFYAKYITAFGNNPYPSFEAESKQLADDLYLLVNKDKCDEIFDYEFSKKTGTNFKYPAGNSSTIGRKRLPPINQKKDANMKEKVIDDFMDLIDPAEKSSEMIKVNEKKVDQIVEEQSKIKQNLQPHLTNQQRNMAIVLTLYGSILGKINYLNTQKVYDLLNRQREPLSHINFKQKSDLASEAVGAALKISIGKYLEDQTQVAFEDFQYYEKNQYLGTMKSAGFSRAVSQGREDVWTIYYAPIKKLMTVKRIASIETSMYILGLNWHIAKAVWNNLKFELLYATNDDDERYSIQTHEYLMRNLLIEACHQPFGYPGYESKQLLII